MRCTLVCRGMDELAKDVLFRWVENHEGYYGQPHGACSVPPPEDLVRFYPPEPHAWQGKVRLGYEAGPDGGRWLRSSGNWASIEFTADSVVVRISGRRHGIVPEVAAMFQGLTWDADRRTLSGGEKVAVVTEYETQYPRESPFRYGLDTARVLAALDMMS